LQINSRKELPWIPITSNEHCLSHRLLEDYCGTILILYKRGNRRYAKTVLCEYGYIPKMGIGEIIAFIPMTKEYLILRGEKNEAD